MKIQGATIKNRVPDPSDWKIGSKLEAQRPKL